MLNNSDFIKREKERETSPVNTYYKRFDSSLSHHQYKEHKIERVYILGVGSELRRLMTDKRTNVLITANKRK